MDSMNRVEIVDDDDFDWAAAVREIDVAWENNLKPSTSYPDESNYTSHFDSRIYSSVKNDDACGSSIYNAEKHKNSRQATLDKFIARPGPFPVQGFRDQSGNRIVDCGAEECPEGDSGGGISEVSIDTDAAKTWVYPVNVPLRDYQFAITKSALFSNTLVTLPTGLGKTLIAAVVMYNYFRWFPKGKIVFAAPSRPLVLQQIEACHNVVGIRQEWTIDLTGQTSPDKRAMLWKSKRVFFVTPQVLEKDIQSGSCPVKLLVCLVIDEAHRASGNYSYCVVVRELIGVPLRILALTATPGSKKQAIQNIIDNLLISNLEYRNESDHDVRPYVHNRNVELIQVPLGRDAVDINNKLLKVIHPFVMKLQSAGLIHHRDYQTLSPCDLLQSRDKFRQAPPSELPHKNHGDIESCFSVLITLYHVRKLLSSHGIRPAYEMLEEKLQKGPFARLMGRNEDIWKVKILMQQSLFHGAPSPKLSKMLEVLVNHFKTKDPEASRVIIFSNFRGSVRDIMNALSNIGNLVKATEFIGQSSGKILKGQSQKVQQAVLEKFRAGGYNVIVATSIGEEGLDIMEVDLVVCFDANVSPLRMIQRMGRTGRKHDGRVVVLACEGSELKGYMRKQESSRSVKRHMHDGGANSFQFHPSPRMIPHIFKPEVQFTELSIEQFVPRGKKPKNKLVKESPVRGKLSTAEMELLAKYFYLKSENNSRLSLIAFPHFQSAPSKVNRVMHSYRTMMFIDAMQTLQEVAFCGQQRNVSVEEEAPIGSRDYAGGSNLANNAINVADMGVEFQDTDLQVVHDDPDNKQCGMTDFEVFEIGKPTTKKQLFLTQTEESPFHCFLFGLDYVSVDAVGKVLITSLPTLSLSPKHPACTSASGGVHINSSKQQFSVLEISKTCNSILPAQPEDFGNPVACQTIYSEAVSTSQCQVDFELRKTQKWAEQVIMNDAFHKDICVVINAPEIKESSSEEELGDHDLSPRLTDFIHSGVVPESPINDCGDMGEIGREHEFTPLKFKPLVQFGDDLKSRNSTPEKCENGAVGSGHFDACRPVVLGCSPSFKLESPKQKTTNALDEMERLPASTTNTEPWRSPLVDLTNTSCSKLWCLSSGERTRSITQPRKLKRLRKIGDFVKKTPLKNLTNQKAREPAQDIGQSCKLKRLRRVGDCSNHGTLKTMKENFDVQPSNLARPLQRRANDNCARGKNKRTDGGKAFIDEEAEVSSGDEASNDEEDDFNEDSYEDSFIDDRIMPSASTQAESCNVDMMAVYRRSLLSQSPVIRPMSNWPDSSPGSARRMTRSNESGSSHSPEAIFSDRSDGAVASETNRQKAFYEAEACDSIDAESRKRKLSLCQSRNAPVINLEEEFSRELGNSTRETRQRITANGVMCDDDEFYETLDLDAIEAQVTLVLHQKAEPPLVHKAHDIFSQPKLQNTIHEEPPSFDLGIL